jgi:hypothetical protein
VLEEELEKLGVEIESSLPPSKQARRAVTWDVARLNEIRRCSSGSTNTAILAGKVSRSSISEMQTLLNAKGHDINIITKRTSFLRELYPRAAAYAASTVESITDSENVFGDAGGVKFAFDGELRESGPYRRSGFQITGFSNGASSSLDKMTLHNLRNLKVSSSGR